MAFVGKIIYKRLKRKALENERRETARYLANVEPVLEEFNIMTDDRVSTEPVDYAREILLENPSILLGRPRDSV